MNDIVAAVQRLQWLASTGGIIDGSQFIYGAFGGEVAWQAWNRGYSTRAHRVGRRIALPPVQSGDTIIAASQSGHVSALSARSGALMWSRTLLDSLGSTPVCSDDYVYLSGLDQHLRCLSLRDNGRPLWTALLKAPLTTSATLIDDVVYQQVHGTGLTAWQATPANAPDGVPKWTAAAVTGDVLATYGDLLLTWDPQLGTLATISPLTGSIDVQLNLAPGTRVQTSAIENGRVFIISPKGRIESRIPAR
jgi:outer membrane protein assembly factor BamB